MFLHDIRYLLKITGVWLEWVNTALCVVFLSDFFFTVTSFACDVYDSKICFLKCRLVV
jgi:hypothetical protein